MPIKLIFQILGFCFLLISCKLPIYKNNIYNDQNTIKIDKTTIESAIKLIGPFDELLRISACGRVTGHSSNWFTYKKLGFAIFSVTYIPEKQNGYKNEIVRNIGIFDTTNLSKRGSKQHNLYIDQDFYSITKSNLKIIWGKPNKIKNIDTLQNYYYYNKNLVFTFNRINENFICLYSISNK